MRILKKLKDRQRSVDKPEDLEKIPLLKIEDITKQCDKLIIAEDEIADTKVLDMILIQMEFAI